MTDEQTNSKPMGETQKGRTEEEDKITPIIPLEIVNGAPLPPTFKLGRQGYFRLQEVERDLFSDIREQIPGSFIISGINRKALSKKNLTETDFMAFFIAVSKALYNQSYLSGNTETNSGLSQEEVESATKALREEAATKARTERDKKRRKALETAAKNATAYMGDIKVYLHELCQDGYGDIKATTLHRKAMAEMIAFLHKTPVEIRYGKRYLNKRYLCTIEEVNKDEKTGITEYHLHLHSAFAENVVRNFGELPQNAMQQLAENTKKLTAIDMKLLVLLSLQDKRQPFIRTLEELLNEIGISINTYMEQKGRVEAKIIGLCETMIKVGIVSSFSPSYITTSRGRKQLSKVTFILNPDYSKNTSEENPLFLPPTE